MRAFGNAMVCAVCLFLGVSVCGCRSASDQAAAAGAQSSGEPYMVRTILREYTAIDPETGTGVYGRYTELQVEGDAPRTFLDAVAECNRRAEASVMSRADLAASREVPQDARENGYQYSVYGYITVVTRADRTAFSFLETEFEKGAGQSDAEMVYRFHGATYDTESGREILLADLAGDGETCAEMLREALTRKFGIPDLAELTPDAFAWTADALGIRFYFHSDAVSKERRREAPSLYGRAVTVGIAYDALPGEKAEALSAAPDAYIAMIDRETSYRLPHGELSVVLTRQDGALVCRSQQDGGETEEQKIEYADDLSDFYILRAAGGTYLFRERIGYQEGFFYDFSRPDGGFGRFAYQTAQYFDSFLREIRLALPYDPRCAHMAEVRRSFGENSYDRSSFVPHGHYSFPGDPDARYKRFLLKDDRLQIDTYNVACRLREDFTATETDPAGKETGEITVPAGSTLIFETVEGEAARYDDPPKRSQYRTFLYGCRLADGTHIQFESTTEPTVSSEKGYLNRFTEPVSLGEALHGEGPGTAETAETFTVRIGGREYPLIPDYSLPGHSGEEIDLGGDLWWQIEGYTGRYVITEEDREEMRGDWLTQEALSHSGDPAELVISEDGQAVLKCFGQTFRGRLPEKRYYRTDPQIFMESETERRTFRIILRDGESHTPPSRIELYSEGEPATNEPSQVPPLRVFMTRER